MPRSQPLWGGGGGWRPRKNDSALGRLEGLDDARVGLLPLLLLIMLYYYSCLKKKKKKEGERKEK